MFRYIWQRLGHRKPTAPVIRRPRFIPWLERLEDRLTQSNASVSVSDSTLTIVKTSGDDNLTIVAVGGGELQVIPFLGNTINNSLAPFTTAVDIKTVTITLGNGNDVVTVDGITNGNIGLSGGLSISGTGGNKTIAVSGVYCSKLNLNLTGNGNETASFTGVNVAGAATISHPGVGTTQLTITSNGSPGPNNLLHWGSLTVTDGQGAKNNIINDTDFASNVTITEGAGAAGNTGVSGGSYTGFYAVNDESLATIGGNLLVTGASGWFGSAMEDYNVMGNVTIKTGSAVANQTAADLVYLEYGQAYANSVTPVIGGNVGITATAVAPGLFIGMGTSLSGGNYPLTVNGSLTISVSGTGAANIDLNDLSVSTQATQITLGARVGGSIVAIQGTTETSHYAALTVNAMATTADNTFDIQNAGGETDFGGTVNLELGSGGDMVQLGDDIQVMDGIQYPFGVVDITGSLEISGTGGNTSITATGTVNGNLLVTANGTGSAQVALHTLATGSTTITLGSQTSDDSVDVEGSYSNAVFNAFSILSAAGGANNFNIQSTTLGETDFQGAVNVQLGRGNDTLDMGYMAPDHVDSSFVKFSNSATFNGGGGVNTLTEYAPGLTFQTSPVFSNFSGLPLMQFSVFPRKPAAFGQPIQVNLHLKPAAGGSGAVTGQVILMDGNTQVAAATVDADGNVVFPAFTLLPGNYTLNASYEGGPGFAAINAVLKMSVARIATQVTLNSSIDSSVFAPATVYVASGQAVNFGSLLSVANGVDDEGGPLFTGTITFADNGNSTALGSFPLGTGLIWWSAQSNDVTLTPGVHHITATYSGDANYLGCSAQLNVMVGPIPTKMHLQNVSIADWVYGQLLTLKAAVTAVLAGLVGPAPPVMGTAADQVTFWDGGVGLGANNVDNDGLANDTVSLLPGRHVLTATFGGDSIFLSSQSADLIVQVSKPALKLVWQTPDAILYGTALTASQLDAVANIPGSFTYSPAVGTVLGAGTQTLTATFTPADAKDYPSNAVVSVKLVVHQAAPILAVSDAGGAFNGKPFAATAMATGAGGAAVNGSFDFTYTGGAGNRSATAPTSPGSYTVVASFTSADSNYGNGQSAVVAFRIDQAAPTFQITAPDGTALSSASADPTISTYNGKPFTVNAQVAGVVAGVDDTLGSTLQGGVLTVTYQNSMQQTLNIVPSAPGIYQVTVLFSGSTDYMSGSGAEAYFTIAKATPAIQVSDAGGRAQGDAYPAMATVAGVVVGADDMPGLTLENVGLTLDYQQVDANGNVLTDLGASAPNQTGFYQVTASFAGSTDYNTVSSVADFTITTDAS